MPDDPAIEATAEFAISAEDEDRQLQLEQLAADFMERGRKGERPSIADYKRQHPELADDLEQLLPAIAKLESLKLLDDSGSRRAVVGLPSLERLGDFRILREVGRGGMGVVFEAEQETLHRRVALKVLGANVAATAADFARFRREAEAAARLHHTNIVPVYGTGDDRGVHFYAMQYIDGWTLAQIIAALAGPRKTSAAASIESTALHAVTGSQVLSTSSSRQFFSSPAMVTPAASDHHVDVEKLSDDPIVQGLMSPRVAAQMGAALADAVAYAHSQGVIHRDIKPSNVLVDRQGTAWLVDFGLAKHNEREPLTQTGHVVGTAQYMAPEQFSGECDEQSDVHSLGLTLYELLCLKPAYAMSNQAKLMQQKTNASPPPIKSVVPHVPRDLETIVMKACAIAREHRYPDASALAADLRRFINDEPVLARRTTIIERAWRWSRRHRIVATLLTTTAALVLALLTSLAIGKYRTEKALAEMATQKNRAQDNLKVAVEALDAILRNVSERGVSQTLRLETAGGETQFSNVSVTAADAELLKTLLQFYDRFARGNSANLDAETARTEAQIGEIEERLGNLDQSKAAYGKSADRYRRLRALDPLAEGLLLAEAEVLNQLGAIRARAGDIRGAMDAHLEAEQEIASFPHRSDSVQFAMAQTLVQTCTVGRTAGAPEILAVIAATGGNAFFPPPPPMSVVRGAPRPWSGQPPSPAMIHEVFEQASTILRDLVLQNPSRPDYRLALAQCELGRREFRDLPINLGSPRGPESAAEAETLLRELVKENPREPRYRFELAKALVTRSGMHDELGPSEQESQLREAITITEELRASSSRLSAYQMLLAQAKHQLANVLKAQDRKPEAGILFEEALRILRGLTAESPTSAFHHVALAQMLVDWSSWQRGEGRVDDARQSLREALAITEKMAPAWGDNPMFQHVLSQLRAAVRAGE